MKLRSNGASVVISPTVTAIVQIAIAGDSRLTPEPLGDLREYPGETEKIPFLGLKTKVIQL